MTQPNALGIPPAEVAIDEGLVRRLVDAQRPDLADEMLTLHGHGWDNVTYRLGPGLAVRLPRIAAAVPLLVNEQNHLATLVPHVEIAVPAPVHRGQPSAEYPWPWSIVPWRRGTNAAVTPLAPDQAPRLGRFLHTLHAMERPALRPNTWRGVPLRTRTGDLRERMEQLQRVGQELPYEAAARIFAMSVEAPIDVDDCWIHGDLHPKNLISDRGVLASVIDWGDMTIGDCANDLAATWMLFDLEDHDALWNSYGPVSAATTTRALGWAVLFGVMLAAAGTHDPELLDAGRRTLARAVATHQPRA